jgi:hypothetical protein
MEAKFAGHVHVYKVAKVCTLLQDMPINISLSKHTQDIFIYLFMICDLFLLLFAYSDKNISRKNALVMPIQKDLG